MRRGRAKARQNKGGFLVTAFLKAVGSNNANFGKNKKNGTTSRYDWMERKPALGVRLGGPKESVI